MKKQKVLYWVFTGLFSFVMLGSAIPGVLMDPKAVKSMHDSLGYPVYLIPFIGVAKVLGVLCILLPLPKAIKEWAYAGLVIDLVGATYSIIAVGSPVPNFVFMALPLTLAALSYYSYRKQAKPLAYRQKTDKSSTSFSTVAFQ